MKSRPGDRIRAIDLLGKLGGVAKDEPIPAELVRLLAEDVQQLTRSAPIGIEIVGKRTEEEVGKNAADVFLSRILFRWSRTLGAYSSGDI